MRIGGLFGALLVACVLGCSGANAPGSGDNSGGGGAGQTSSGGSGAGSDDGGGSNTGASGSGSGGSGATGSSNSGGASGGGASGGATGASSSSGAASVGNTGSSGSEGGIVSSDAAPMNDPDIDYSVAPVTLTMSTFNVSPGAEVYYCQNFANPWGKQVDVKTYDLSMGAGSHHMFAFYATGATNGAIAPCPSGGLTFGAFTFTAGAPNVTQTYPQSVGATIPSGTGFQLMVHYLNTTQTTITSSVKLTMYVAKAGAVTNHAGVLYLNQGTMSVAASCTSGCQSSQNYTLTQDVHLLWSASHMHKYGTNFVATTSTGVTLYQTTQWAEPPAKGYSPPLLLPSGTTITWTCTDVNTTGQTLTFGESANTNVMCISVSAFYPVTNVSNPVLGTNL